MASILVVEDEVLIRIAMVATLSAQGHSCREAWSADAAIAALEAQRPDLLVLDWNLAEGGNAAEIVTANARRVPVILATATIRPEEAQAMGAALLPKPYSAAVLLRTVRTALGQAA